MNFISILIAFVKNFDKISDPKIIESDEKTYGKNVKNSVSLKECGAVMERGHTCATAGGVSFEGGPLRAAIVFSFSLFHFGCPEEM